MTTKVSHCMHDVFDRYIGRSMPQFPKGSIYGNPFVIGRDGSREEVLHKHKLWVFGHLDCGIERPTINEIRSLKDQTLGCWCRRIDAPRTKLNCCHGDLYADLADACSYLWYCFSKTADESWLFLEKEFNRRYMIDLSNMLGNIDTSELCPAPNHIFRAFRLPLNKVKVVIVGQDPYPNRSHANGLAFAYAGDKAWPMSLRNIFRECRSDLNVNTFDPTLVHWLRQGVLLLNTSLTTVIGKPGAHASWGWQDFTQTVINRISQQENVIFLLWGRHAQSLEDSIEQGYILKSAHPSPFSCKDFFGNEHFSKTNRILLKLNKKPIRWDYEQSDR